MLAEWTSEILSLSLFGLPEDGQERGQVLHQKVSTLPDCAAGQHGVMATHSYMIP